MSNCYFMLCSTIVTVLLIALIYCLQQLAKHVMKVHLNAQQPDEESEGELPLAVMKKYIAYCKR